MRKSILWSLLAALPLLGQVYLIKDGTPKAVIVLESDNVSTRKAGEELQAMLERRTGARLPMQTATDPLPSGTLPVHLGLSERSAQYGVDGTKIPFDGYFFKATPERMVIAGRDAPQTDEAYHGHRQVVCNYKLNYYVFGEKGTCNGVYKILEKYAGNRHYMPGELGDVVPQSPDFALPVTEFVEAPAFRERYFYGCYFRDTSEDFLRWFYRLCAGGENHSINHSYGGMIQFKDTHPEYFALIDGKRDFSNLSTANNYGNLCMTNREGIEAFAQRAQKFFSRAPGYKVFPVVPQDGLFRICECPDCQKLYSPHLGPTGKFSNAVFHHAKAIAEIVGKTNPDKLIGTLAYAGYRVPPEFDLPPNLAVRICYTRQSLRTPQNKKLVEDAIKGYAAKKVPILVWTYPLFNHIPPMRGIPVFYPHILQENMRFNRDHGVIGEFSEASYYSGGGDQAVKPSQVGFPGFTHLNDYVRCQLLWNPDLNLEAMLDEYYHLFYGPAANAMREFWQTAEQLFLKNGEATMYSTADLDTFDHFLNAAIAATAQEDTVYAKRVRLIQNELAPFFKTMRLLRDKGKFLSVPVVTEDIPQQYDPNGVWGRAAKYTLNYKDGRTNIPQEDATRLYTLANSKCLALHIDCGEPNLDKMVAKSTKRDDSNAWLDDCFELFLSTKDRKINIQYILTVGGFIFDGRRGVDVNVGDWAWSSGLTMSQTRGKDSHATTVLIPWSDLDSTFENVPEMLIQLFRRQTKGDPKNGIYYTLFPSLGYHNYSPEYFGPIHFLGPENRLFNGDFEELDAKGNLAGWTIPSGTLSNDHLQQGRNCLRLTGVKGGKDQMGISRRIPVEPDQDYIITLYHQGASLYLYTLFYDQNGKRIPDPERLFQWKSGSKDWTFASFQGRVPAGAVSCSVGLRNFETGKLDGCFVDAVQFYGGVSWKANKP